MNVLSTAVEGIDRAQAKVDRAAKRLAQFAAFEDSSPVDTVELSDEIVSLVAAQNAHAANATVVRTAAELESKLLDILA
jgi:flagellar basal body rod protein FlgG